MADATRFEEQLQLLNKEMIDMGSMIERAIESAGVLLSTRDLEAARLLRDGDNEIDRKEREIETLCLRLILMQQPVARDLRLISAALKMITDMERIGDQASDIAEIITMPVEGDLPLPTSCARWRRIRRGWCTRPSMPMSRGDLTLARQVMAG